MKVSPQALYAVLTGDVIGSRRWQSRSRPELYDALQQVSKQMQHDFGKAVPLHLDPFRGDSWQLLVTQPALALRIALAIRTSLRLLPTSHRLDSRIAIGLGRIDFLPNERTSQGDGPAFQLSGQALMNLKSQHLALAATPELWPDSTLQLLQTVVHHIDFLLEKWSAKQCRAILGALLKQTQETIGQSWPQKAISQQAVAQHLQRAGWNPVQQSLAVFESLCTDLTNKP
ncbi:hypothetical protein JW992_12660 [candidate division KSB1 bacterium]|nr:hypothetical protein [candidate division KSB1 bacterium]